MPRLVAASAAALALVASACLSSSVVAPARGSPPSAYPGCTTSRRAPIADLAIAGVGAAATGGLIYAHFATETDGGTPALGVIFTVPIFIAGAVSGGYGLAKVGRCRRGLARYRAEGPGPAPRLTPTP